MPPPPSESPTDGQVRTPDELIRLLTEASESDSEPVPELVPVYGTLLPDQTFNLFDVLKDNLQSLADCPVVLTVADFFTWKAGTSEQEIESRKIPESVIQRLEFTHVMAALPEFIEPAEIGREENEFCFLVLPEQEPEKKAELESIVPPDEGSEHLVGWLVIEPGGEKIRFITSEKLELREAINELYQQMGIQDHIIPVNQNLLIKTRGVSNADVPVSSEQGQGIDAGVGHLATAASDEPLKEAPIHAVFKLRFNPEIAIEESENGDIVASREGIVRETEVLADHQVVTQAQSNNVTAVNVVTVGEQQVKRDATEYELVYDPVLAHAVVTVSEDHVERSKLVTAAVNKVCAIGVTANVVPAIINQAVAVVSTHNTPKPPVAASEELLSVAASFVDVTAITTATGQDESAALVDGAPSTYRELFGRLTNQNSLETGMREVREAVSSRDPVRLLRWFLRRAEVQEVVNQVSERTGVREFFGLPVQAQPAATSDAANVAPANSQSLYRP